MIGFDQLVQAAVALSAAIAVPFGLSVRSRLHRFDGQLFSVTGPPSSGSSEQLFQTLHGLLRPPVRRLLSGQPWISLELVGRAGQVRFQIWIPAGERPFIESLLRAIYPAIELTPVTEPQDGEVAEAFADVHLARGNYLPLQTTFDAEPLSNVFWTLARARGSESITLQILVKPKSSAWQTAARLLAQGLRDGNRGLRGVLLGIPAPDLRFGRKEVSHSPTNSYCLEPYIAAVQASVSRTHEPRQLLLGEAHQRIARFASEVEQGNWQWQVGDFRSEHDSVTRMRLVFDETLEALSISDTQLTTTTNP